MRLVVGAATASDGNEAQDRPGAHWRRGIEREPAAVDDAAATRAHLRCRVDAPRPPGVECRAAGGYVDTRSVHVYRNRRMGHRKLVINWPMAEGGTRRQFG